MKMHTPTTFLSTMALFSLFLGACKNEDQAVTVKTYPVTNVSPTSAIFHGKSIFSDAGIKDVGIIYTSATVSEIEYLKIYNSRKALKTSGSFSDFKVSLAGLSPDSTYRFRAYAQTSDSCYYGTIYSFKPMSIDIPTVLVPGGSFVMGATSEQSAFADADEIPTHAVTLNDFRIGKYEVTNAQFVKFLRSRCVSSGGTGMTAEGVNRSFISTDYTRAIKYSTDSAKWVVQPGYENVPAIYVSWYGANEFCQWAGGRLPSEAEWEYAARGANTASQTIYSGSDTPAEVAWYKANNDGLNDVHPVGGKRGNNLLLFDMSGNAWEWVSDWYASYSSKAQSNPSGLTDDEAEKAKITEKVRRGGGWADPGVSDLRVSARASTNPETLSGSIGFRFAKDVK